MNNNEKKDNIPEIIPDQPIGEVPRLRPLKNIPNWNITKYSCPGIFKIQFKDTQRSYFDEAENDVWVTMRTTLDLLEEGVFYGTEELVRDYDQFGAAHFTGSVVEYGLHLRDKAARQAALQRIKGTCQDPLY